jgi:hypothetical protein
MDCPTHGIFVSIMGLYEVQYGGRVFQMLSLGEKLTQWCNDLRWRCTERVSAYWRDKGFSSRATGFMLIILKANGELLMRLSSARIHQFRPRYEGIQYKLQTALI